MPRSTVARRGEDYPLPIWWHITSHLTSVGDVHRFSRVSKGMAELLAYRRAAMEAEHYMESILNLPRWCDSPHPARSCVESAIRRGRSLDEIDALVRGCSSVSIFYLTGTEPITRNGPALFVAAEMNRVDVMKLLLASGSHHDLRYPVRQGCIDLGHYECVSSYKTCRNALCVAREHGSRDAEAFLLKQGIDDLCDAHCARWHH
ncbi:hypothetical protein GGR52DRAFT_376787 [Hypoxylon sp. FL1284]|nr:hypothetical protein GGR52DRAFT_376787 [Hypoxylon sp. FL1284]